MRSGGSSKRLILTKPPECGKQTNKKRSQHQSTSKGPYLRGRFLASAAGLPGTGFLTGVDPVPFLGHRPARPGLDDLERPVYRDQRR